MCASAWRERMAVVRGTLLYSYELRTRIIYVLRVGPRPYMIVSTCQTVADSRYAYLPTTVLMLM